MNTKGMIEYVAKSNNISIDSATVYFYSVINAIKFAIETTGEAKIINFCTLKVKKIKGGKRVNLVSNKEFVPDDFCALRCIVSNSFKKRLRLPSNK